MFRPREVIIRLAVKHFKRNIKIAVLEVRSHFLHGTFTVSFFLFNIFKFLM